MILDYLEEVDGCDGLDTVVVEEPREVADVFVGGNKLNILHLNIRSLQKNFTELLIYLDLLKLNNIDLIILSETFAINNLNNFRINNFDILYNKSYFNKNDGLVLYIRDTIPIQNKIFNLTETNLLRCTFKIDEHNFGITASYRPPSTQLNLYLDELEVFFANLNMLENELFVGDININILNEQDIFVTRYLNIMAQGGFVSCINSVTRETQLSLSAIDHIFLKMQNLNERKDYIKPIILKSALTDHYTTALSVDNIKTAGIDLDSQQHYKITIDYANLTNSLKNESWHDVFNNFNIEESHNIFKTKLINYILKYTKTKKITCKNKKRKPWVSQGLINSIIYRDKLKRELHKNFSMQLSNQYKKYRNTLNKLIQKEKNNYYKQKIIDSANDYKKVWGFINELTGSKKNTSKNICLLDNDKMSSDNWEVSNIFNNFFIKIGHDIQKSITKTTKHPLIPKTMLSNSLFLTPVNENEIIQHINSLKTNSAPGEDKITSTLIKHIHSYIIGPIKHIINLSFTNFDIPCDWKMTIVTPIYKTGEKNLPTNFRPISLINNFAKIFEKCLKKRLVGFLEQHNLIYSQQYGFRQGKSTEDAVFQLVSDLQSNFKLKKKSLGVFLDLKKAFDTVSHKELLNRLEELGVRDGPLQLFGNYLKGRKQKVRVNECYSNCQSIETGVPQGTVLGPILFLVYINNIGKLLDDCSVISYADDTVLLFSENTWENTYRRAEMGLSKIHNWLNDSLLSLNHEKTFFITFSATAADQPIKDSMTIHTVTCQNYQLCNCHIIKRVNKLKYLGVMVDCNLRWDEHITYLAKKVRVMFYKFYQLRDILNKKLLLITYGALVESILRYCITIWGNSYNNTLKILETCQNTLLKIILHKQRRYSTLELYKSSNTLNLRNLYVMSILNYLSKNPQLCSLVSHTYHTRLKVNENLVVPLLPTAFCQRFFSYFAPKVFNMLPEHLRIIIKNTNLFKKRIKTFILNNPTFFVHLFS